MSKYYTPKIEEFHVGFEYEYKINDNWVKTEVKQEFLNSDLLFKINGIGHWNSLKPRVKYLDKKDIESLGFKFVSNGWWSTHLAGDGYQILWEKGKKLNLSYGQHEFSTVKFDGMIKNKSELKVLLKQLGINE